MKIRLSSIVTFGFLLISAVQGSFYLLWGTRFLYHSHKFEVDANATRKAPDYENRYGFRGQKYIDSIGQDVVEKNKKLFDVEDSTRKYPSPLSYWYEVDVVVVSWAPPTFPSLFVLHSVISLRLDMRAPRASPHTPLTLLVSTIVVLGLLFDSTRSDISNGYLSIPNRSVPKSLERPFGFGFVFPFPYYQKPKYRYPVYDRSGRGALFYGYGGPEMFQYKEFTPLEGHH